MPAIAVFDTNILFSGVGWKGNPYRCLELARAGMVEGVTCRELLDELAEKLQSETHGKLSRIDSAFSSSPDRVGVGAGPSHRARE